MALSFLRRQTHTQKRNRHLAVVLHHKLSPESLWIDGLCICPWINYDLAQGALPQAQDRNAVRAIASFIVSLKGCAREKDLVKGACLHDELLKSGLIRKCSDALLTMYAKCGELAKARELLESHKSRNVFAWNALISAYIQNDQAENSLLYFERMLLDGVRPDAASFSCVLKACASLRALDEGERFHDQITRQGLLQNNLVIGTSLVDMYIKCGALTKASRVFEELPVRNTFSWSALIAGYTEHGKGEQALTCFERMQLEGVSPDAVTLISILKACGSINAFDIGQKIHNKIDRKGLLRDNVVLGTALVDMYAKCGALSKARNVFEELSARNGISWNALISGYAQDGDFEEALRCFTRMRHEGYSSTTVTYASILKAFSSLQVKHREQIHEEISKKGLLKQNIVLGNALVDMYARCGALKKAAEVVLEMPLRNVITWSTLLAGYSQQSRVDQAFQCFEQMQSEGVCPNVVTFICLVSACSNVDACYKGLSVHNEIAKHKLLKDNVALGNALVNMYAKCGIFTKAQEVLQDLPVRTVVSWNALIAGYIKHNKLEQALPCFEQMQHEGVSPDTITLVCILKACSDAGAIGKGAQIHQEIVKQELPGFNVILGTALVDMYAKCGALSTAWGVLEDIPAQNAISWNALLTGSVMIGEAEKALACFEYMQCEGFCPDAATFSCLLSSCSHSGSLKVGLKYFLSMNAFYGMRPDYEHYTCMIDLFARAGCFEKAVCFLQRLPPYFIEGWSILLGACQKWGGVNTGTWAFEYIQASLLVANCQITTGQHEDLRR